ncbi:MAG: metallophosphoesterase family protein [Dehalococcoidales bacterium]|jgi:predicted phosphodiesterase|nr:metallophosphoesterase family protein [Dehalococcoidales bacterium]|tara:strand:+ start:8109 stop:8843 length:735 start_codon:yes stop_codon:yes gene_type:complete
MRYAIIADIHANLEALTAVMEDIKKRGGVERIWCLGDVVDYGPDPHECIELLRQRNHIGVAGNHDLAAIGNIDTTEFHPDAAVASHWTSQQLKITDIEYLRNLPLVIEKDDFTLVHGSPRNPSGEYVISSAIAEENLPYFKSPFCLVGHTHIPFISRYQENGACSFDQFSGDAEFALGSNRLILNPGGVGQPRDGDPRASYAIYDSESIMVHLYRVAYDIATTQAKMLKYGLPVNLITRLSYGW